MSNDLYKTPEAELLQTQFSKNEIINAFLIAKRQKALIYSFLSYILFVVLLVVINAELKIIFQSLQVIAILAIIISTSRLCWILYGKVIAVIMILLSIIPIINLVVLFIANSKANKHVKNTGFDVGFMGANIKEISNKITAM